MQVDPVKPTVKAPEIKLLKLNYGKALSEFGFEINLRRYSKGAAYSPAMAAALAPVLAVTAAMRVWPASAWSVG